MTLREALYESNNQAAVKLQTQVGSRPVLRLAESVGLPRMPDVPSLALGRGRSDPAAADHRVCGVSKRRFRRGATADRAGAR